MAEEGIVRNQDNEFCMPREAGRIIMGDVDEVNGVDAEEVPGFVPTRHELLELVNYWYRVVVEGNYFFFQTGQTGRSERERRKLAWRRIDLIASLLGGEVVSKALDDVEAEFRKKADPEDWEAYKSGDADAWMKVQDRFYAMLDAHGGNDSMDAAPADDSADKVEPNHEAGEEREARDADRHGDHDEQDKPSV